MDPERKTPPKTNTQKPAFDMAPILRRVPPIEGVFDPNEEVKNILRHPSKERRRVLEGFKDKWAGQTMAWALCRIGIEKLIYSNPDLPREEMVRKIHEFASHYGFAPAYVLEAESLVDRYIKMHERVKELGEEYKDNKKDNKIED
jgi:hypothetical protein